MERNSNMKQFQYITLRDRPAIIASAASHLIQSVYVKLYILEFIKISLGFCLGDSDSFFLGHGNRAVVVLHPLGHLDAQQAHAVADNLRHVGSKYQAHLFLCLGVGIEDAVVVVELVELLGEFIAVVGDAAG